MGPNCMFEPKSITYIKSLVACVRLSDVTFRGRIGLCLSESFEVRYSMAEPAFDRFYEDVIMFKLHSAQQVQKPSVRLLRSWNPSPESQISRFWNSGPESQMQQRGLAGTGGFCDRQSVTWNSGLESWNPGLGSQISRSWNPGSGSQISRSWNPRSWESNIEVLKPKSWEPNIEVLKPRSWEWHLLALANCVRPSRVPTSIF
jgi:hypothetical protein